MDFEQLIKIINESNVPSDEKAFIIAHLSKHIPLVLKGVSISPDEYGEVCLDAPCPMCKGEGGMDFNIDEVDDFLYYFCSFCGQSLVIDVREKEERTLSIHRDGTVVYLFGKPEEEE